MDNSQKIIQLLKENLLTFGTAESCTGGLIAKKITDIAGSSEIYKGSVIAYSNEIKQSVLKIPTEILEVYGAVSEETVQLMVKNAANLLNVDIAVATSGIAGPGGGTTQKPVGTVCFGFYIKEQVFSETSHFKGSREIVRESAADFALQKILVYMN